MLDRKRKSVKDIGGKVQLKLLQESGSQDARCDEIEEMENSIASLRERLVTLRKYIAKHDQSMLPPASPSA
jgi:hypothetical protein